MAKKTIREEQKSVLWKGHLDKWSRSGMTQAEYCRRHKLSTKSFTYWKRRLKEKSPVTFIPVEVKTEPRMESDKSSGILLIKEGYRIEIREGFKQEALREVLRTIGELSC